MNGWNTWMAMGNGVITDVLFAVLGMEACKGDAFRKPKKSTLNTGFSVIAVKTNHPCTGIGHSRKVCGWQMGVASNEQSPYV